MSFDTPVSSAGLALATTAHLALIAVRHHRQHGRGGSPLVVVSFLFAGLPWLAPTAAGVAATLAIHGLWFAVCEWLAPAVRHAVSPTTAAQAHHTSADRTVRPRGFVDTPLLAVVDESPDIRTFRFARPPGFEFVAGQFLTIRVRTENKDLVRCYSLSSSPNARGYLDVTVKRQGVVSSLLHGSLRPGSIVPIKVPAGAFVYPAGDDRPLLLLAGGIGITPLLSMLRYATEQEPWRRVVLLYSVRHEEQLAFHDEIGVLARRHPQVRATFAATSGPTSDGVYPGRIDEALIRTVIPDARDAIAFICGPLAMIDGLREVLASMGLPPAQIRFERFEAAIAAAGTDVSQRRALVEEALEGSCDVRCVRSRRTLRAARGESLLDAAEAGGVVIESLCRAGVCGTCRTRVIDGHLDCDSTALDARDRADGYVLACVARVTGPCAVEA